MKQQINKIKFISSTEFSHWAFYYLPVYLCLCICLVFAARDIRDVITDSNYGDDRLRRFWVAMGQILGFFVAFAVVRIQYSRTTVRVCDKTREWALHRVHNSCQPFDRFNTFLYFVTLRP